MSRHAVRAITPIFLLATACTGRSGFLAPTAMTTGDSAAGIRAPASDVDGDFGGDSNVIPDGELCSLNGIECGAATVTDNSMPRQVDCGSCQSPMSCGGGGGVNVCGCTPESDGALCAAFTGDCGWLIARDDCGVERHIDCGVLICSVSQLCGASAPFSCGAASSIQWEGLGNSDFGGAENTTRWGSAEGSGISGDHKAILGLQVAFGADGQPRVLWHSENDRLHVQRWDGAGWTPYPTTWSQAAGNSHIAQTVMAIDAGGNPVVAAQLGTDIHVLSWDGSSWRDLGGSDGPSGLSNSSQGASWPSIAVHPAGEITVAWRESMGGDGTIYLKRWNGSSWLELGGSATGDGVTLGGKVLSGTLALQPGGNPVIAWAGEHGGVGARLYVKLWTGAAWQELAGSATGAGVSGDSTAGHSLLAVDTQGRIVVAWSASTSASATFLRRWDGVAWRELGTSGSQGGLGPDVDLLRPVGVQITTTGNPCVAGMAAGDAVVRCWDTAQWANLGGVVQSAASPHGFAISAADTMFLAWAPGHPVRDVFAKHWDGAQWLQLGAGNATGAVSQSAGDVGPSQLVFDPQGMPVAAWIKDPWFGAVVTVRRWTGGSWVQVGEAFAGAQIWLSPEGPKVAMVAPSGGNIALAWSEDTALMVRQWSGEAWLPLGGVNDIGTDSKRKRLPEMVGDANAITIAWLEEGAYSIDASAVMVRQWDGTEWRGLDGSDTFPGIGSADYERISGDDRFRSDGLAIALDPTGLPVVAWTGTVSGSALLRRWTGAYWEELAGSATSGGPLGIATGGENSPTLTVDSVGRITLAHANSGRVYSSTWNGSSWQALPLILRNPVGGTSPIPDAAPDVGVTAANEPVLVYSFIDSYSGAEPISAIYLSIYRGGAWREIAGSASGRGISNTRSVPFNPSLSMRGSVACVSWNETGADNYQVLMRCLNLQ